MTRKWRIVATITMPRFVLQQNSQPLPAKIDTVNVYNERPILVSEDKTIWLRCKRSVTKPLFPERYTRLDVFGETDRAYVSPDSWPYFLETETFAENGQDAVDSIIQMMELGTEFLTFLLQYPVQIISLQAESPKGEVKDEFEVVVIPAVPYYKIVKEAIATFLDQSYLDFDGSFIRSDIEEELEASLRWFSKGITTMYLVDKFVFYWIAFETLAARWKLKDVDERNFLECPRCHRSITSCPHCGQPTLVGTKLVKRVLRVGEMLGRDEKLMRRLYRMRHMVHGRLRLKDAVEIEELPELTQQLRSLVVDSIKTRLGIPLLHPPFVNFLGPIMWVGSMWAHGTRKAGESSD